MTAKVEQRTYEEAVNWLRDHGFDLIEAPGTQIRVFLKKYNCSAAIQKTADGGAKIFAYPGYMIGSEISKLVNRGYQQFMKTTKTEVPATADHLKALQQFAEELKEALGSAQPLQRVARHHQRFVPLRSHQGPRRARGRTSQAPVGNGEGESESGGEEKPRLNTFWTAKENS